MNKANDAQKLAFAYLSRSFGIRQSKDERIIQERMFFILREAPLILFRLSSVGSQSRSFVYYYYLPNYVSQVSPLFS